MLSMTQFPSTGWLCALLLVAGTALADVPYNPDCGHPNGVRQRDYFDFLDPTSKQRLDIVEEYHFTPEIENLVRGITGTVPGELDFVLRALPNHYRGLIAMAKWQRLHPMAPDQLEGRVYTSDCYFQRAIWVRGDDPKLRILYGTFLYQQGRLPEADREYEVAERLGVSGADLYYNRGLLKFQQGDYAAARAYADKAYALNYPLPGLRNKLAALSLPKADVEKPKPAVGKAQSADRNAGRTDRPSK
jgi:tetratricopeptide (TPR) repeat protein